jgi:hypothetical protein
LEKDYENEVGVEFVEGDGEDEGEKIRILWKRIMKRRWV